jgi:hypothetical protein
VLAREEFRGVAHAQAAGGIGQTKLETDSWLEIARTKAGE